jgi:hypothetical protein
MERGIECRLWGWVIERSEMERWGTEWGEREKKWEGQCSRQGKKGERKREGEYGRKRREREKEKKEVKERKEKKGRERETIWFWNQFGFSVIEPVCSFVCQSESKFNLMVYLF